jgi:GntR family transcriptional regulator
MQRTHLSSAPRVTVRQLANEVADRLSEEFVFSGKVEPGSLLPSETKLAEHYGVSRVTLRSALRMLQDAHLIRIRNGIGSVVLPRPAVVTEGLDQLCSLETYARDASWAIDTIELEWREEKADEEAAAKLRVEVGAPLHVAQRVKVLGETRVGFGVERVPATLLPLEVLQAEFAGSVMDVLLAHPELGVEHADAELFAVALPPAVARLLGVKPRTVAQVLEQVMFTGDGAAVQWGRAWLLPDYYRLQVRRRLSLTPPTVHRSG